MFFSDKADGFLLDIYPAHTVRVISNGSTLSSHIKINDSTKIYLAATYGAAESAIFQNGVKTDSGKLNGMEREGGGAGKKKRDSKTILQLDQCFLHMNINDHTKIYLASTFFIYINRAPTQKTLAIRLFFAFFFFYF